MNITLDQARALDALERHGTLMRAAKALHKGHTAVLYAIRMLEEQTELTLLDRTGYRNALTPAGKRVLEYCRKLLSAEQELATFCDELRAGWEPSLRVVCDGIVPLEPVFHAVRSLVRAKAPTRISVHVEFLGGVEAAFLRDDADLMISVLPPTGSTYASATQKPIRAHLVVHKSHPLATLEKPARTEDLAEHVLVTVRGSDPRLQLPTSVLDRQSTVEVADFVTKKAAILSGVGFGWMPDYLIESELERRTLQLVRYREGTTHLFRPRLYRRTDRPMGRATASMHEALTQG